MNAMTSRATRTLGRILAVALLVGVAFTAGRTGAQTGATPRRRAKPARTHRVVDGGPSLDAGVAPEPARAHEGRGDAGSGELLGQKTLDGGGKVFRFGELEIEGRLKNPQLVFFLRRVRAEFAAGDLGHRSFLRELSETKQDPNF